MSDFPKVEQASPSEGMPQVQTNNAPEIEEIEDIIRDTPNVMDVLGNGSQSWDGTNSNGAAMGSLDTVPANKLVAYNKYDNNIYPDPLQPLSDTALPNSMGYYSMIKAGDKGLKPQSFRKTKKKPTPSGPKTRPAFVMKLWNMVHDPSNQAFIRWLPDGKSFQVTNREDFLKHVLPKYFKHNNFASFVRQLNMYGWHKVQDVGNGSLTANEELWQFENPNFIRDREDLLDQIVRNKSKPGEDDENIDFGLVLNELETIKMNQMAISEDLRRIRQDNETLWQEHYLARERHKTQAETLEKMMRFLASVYGNNSKLLSEPTNDEFQKSSGAPQRHETSNISKRTNAASKKLLMLTDHAHKPSTNGSSSTSGAATGDVTPTVLPSHNSSVASQHPFIQEIVNRSNQNLAPINSMPSPGTFFPELNEQLNESASQKVKNHSSMMQNVEDNINQQGESIKQIHEWINKLAPVSSTTNSKNTDSDAIADDDFDVNDFFLPHTPVDEPGATSIPIIEELTPTDSLKRENGAGEGDNSAIKRAKK
ncbi:hypothetical protein LJB42_001416 [Komagataella kurtzmanii]|nr:hypothetical protein LJB42_001416 [Komagataella kurtzmanii]